MRLRLASLLLLFVAFACPALAHAKETPAEHAANVYAINEMKSYPVNGNLPDYSLAPGDLAKAQHLNTVGSTLAFADTAWDLVTTILLLSLGIIAWMQNQAKATSRNRWAQGFVFYGLFTLIAWIVNLPLSLYRQHLMHVYGLSVQSWGSWLWDETKGFLIGWVIGTAIMMLLFWVIRTFPRRWWLVFWGFSIPLVFIGLFAGPYVNFAFNTYEPLTKNHAELVTKLEKIVEKGHMGIPPERMYLMKASEKVTTMNADVEGFGASKRVVVWDNTISKMTDDEVLGVFGHESGHYVLHHIDKGIVVAIIIIFFCLWIGYAFVQWAIARYGAKWGIPSQSDWGALAVLMLSFSLVGIFLQPLSDTLSRGIEHEADVYGQEAIHGIVANPQAAMQGAFIALGKVSYAVPNPSPVKEFWLYNHPAVGRRAAFAHVYDPWEPGVEPKYFPKQ